MSQPNEHSDDQEAKTTKTKTKNKSKKPKIKQKNIGNKVMWLLFK